MPRLLLRKQPSRELVIYIAGSAGLIYAVLLGLTIAIFQNTKDHLKNDIGREASSLSTIYRSTDRSPEPFRSDLNTESRDYTHYAVIAAAVAPQKHSESEISWPRELVAVSRLVTAVTSEVDQSESDILRPEAVITEAPPEPERGASGVTELGRVAVSDFARVLASTGLNIQRLFPQFGLNRAEGGPFVPPAKGYQLRGIDSNTIEGIRGLMKSLPLSVPLEHFRLESRFGPRRDPFNRRPSFHTGLDFSTPYMSPIYATAPGTVTYAGHRGDYGRAVEIDHGNGISTLYGHMHRYTVSVGQKVAEHTQIGFLGSTGRSSGPHVHYEILVNGEPQDPEKFIGLARVIQSRIDSTRRI